MIVKSSTAVVLSVDTSSAILEIVEYDKNKNLINRGVKTNSTYYNLTTNTSTRYIRVSYQNNATKVMFEYGSTASPYEPYQSQSYEINLASKNLLPNIANSVTITGITFNVNADKSVTVNGTATADVSLKITDYLTFKESNYILSGCPSGGSNSTYSMVLEGTGRDTGNGATFTSATNKRVAIEIKNGVTVNNLVFKPMIEKGSTATPYEEFWQIELAKISTYKDKIYNDDNDKKWYLRKEIGKAILDGTDTSYSGGTTGTNAYYLFTNITTLNNNAIGLAYSNMFKLCSFNDRVNGLDVVYSQNGGLNLRTANNTSIDWSTAENRKSWLQTNKPIVYYVLATPTNTEITNETLISQLEAVKLLSGTQNNFTIDADTLPTLNLNYIGEANPHL